MAQHQQVAHERLYLWVQQKCPDVDSEMPDTQTSVLLRRALLVLRQRPAYYKCVATLGGACSCREPTCHGWHPSSLFAGLPPPPPPTHPHTRHCQDIVTNTRRTMLARRFVDALTRGGPNGTPRCVAHTVAAQL